MGGKSIQMALIYVLSFRAAVCVHPADKKALVEVGQVIQD